jgi:hypothetical protein
VKEPFPEGTSVVYPMKITNKKVKMHGSVISVPLPSDFNALPDNSLVELPYKIWLIDDLVFSIPPSLMMDEIVDFQASSSRHGFTILSWSQSNQRVMCLRDAEYIKGHMEDDMDSHQWQFAKQCHNGDKIWSTSLPNFTQEFQKYIDDGTLIPGWHKNAGFIHGCKSCFG